MEHMGYVTEATPIVDHACTGCVVMGRHELCHALQQIAPSTDALYCAGVVWKANTDETKAEAVLWRMGV